jgi:hypothetical protein
MFGHREKFQIRHSVIRCDNTKCPNDRRKTQTIVDCDILNEMIGREVCKAGIGLCMDCIKFYYKKSYEEIIEIDNKKQVQKN